MGVVAAAVQATREGVKEISVIEFGVAGGEGLLALESESEVVERETGIRIRVFGFDNGANGLPEPIGDYRDLPDRWKSGDYAMDEAALKGALAPRRTLILETFPKQFRSSSGEASTPRLGLSPLIWICTRRLGTHSRS